MNWRKEFGTDNNMKNMEYVLVAIVVFSVIGIFFHRSITFLIVGVFVAYFVINRLYDRKIGANLDLANARQSIKLFPGEEAELTFEFQNHSIFPMINGDFQFQTGPSIKATKHVESSSKHWNQFKLPLSIMGKRKTTIRIPVKAEQRGTSKIRNLVYIFPHLFNFDKVNLTYSPLFHTEFVVFPTLIPVKGIEDVFYMIQGSQRTRFSPFEDVLSPLGTRDYHYNDPFHRINWKASAKTQGLQTNVYEKDVDMTFIFIVNLGLEKNFKMSHFSKNMEQTLSQTAYLCRYATEKGFPFEVFINARKPGKVPYVILPEGEGKTHYLHALEMLARIQRQSMVVPFNQMLHRIGQQLYKPVTVIFVGDIPPDTGEIMKTWKNKQKNVFQITADGDEAIVKPWVKDAMYHAK